MRVFVTGGTGFLGKRIVKELLEKNYEVIVLVRNKQKLTEIHENIEIIQGSLNDDFSDKLVNIDVVIHNAAKTPGGNFEIAKENKLKKDFYEINYKGTRNLIEICERKNIKQFIYISSHAVSDQSNQDYYTLYKREAENIVEKSTLNWSIVRPSGIIGITNYWVQLFNSYSEKKIFILKGIGNTIVDYIYVDDLAAKICNILGSEDAVHQRYLAVGEKISYYNFLKLLKEVFKYKFVILNIPLSVLKVFVIIIGVFNKKIIYNYKNIKSRYKIIEVKGIKGFIVLEPKLSYRKMFTYIKEYSIKE